MGIVELLCASVMALSLGDTPQNAEFACKNMSHLVTEAEKNELDPALLVSLIHHAGALACVDGVAYAPHRGVDVKSWDVDFYLCSLYKIYGPHLGVLYAKREHLERAANNNHSFLENKQ